MHRTSPSPLPERTSARWKKGGRILFQGRSAASTLRTLPGFTKLRAIINEAKNLNSRLAIRSNGMYTGHRSRGSSPPPAPERSPDARRSRRDRRRDRNRLSAALLNCSKGN
ncbi:hypothetical protein PVAP13_1KG305605 [Panicum virgatum]|uniref:Uncharacterized protein n=1 Tax=Panicum virgatum TaxID=38727 RepID=A0A8T0XHK3_PANVG|nr:hypothetical protein PVAP13_1KG305605 [Panicum virgatum]